MPEETAQIGIDGPVRPVRPERINPISVDTVVPQVFFLSQYSTTGAQKAAELTNIIQSILNLGIYPSMDSAYEKGIPVGTFVLIDDPETPEKDFSVQVVYATSEREKEVAIEFPKQAN